VNEIAVRHRRKFQRPSGSSADYDFDDILFEQWKLHLAGLPIEVAVTKVWKSHYWKEWLQTIVIDIDETLDIDVSDAEGPGRHCARACTPRSATAGRPDRVETPVDEGRPSKWPTP
jgi:hypothetical protein